KLIGNESAVKPSAEHLTEPATTVADLPPSIDVQAKPEHREGWFAPQLPHQAAREAERDVVQQVSPPKPSPKARDEVAAATGDSPRTVQNALKVRNDAVPEVVQAVRDGRLAVDAALQVAKLPEEQQRKVVERAGLDKPGAEVRGGLVRAYVKQEKRA